MASAHGQQVANPSLTLEVKLKVEGTVDETLNFNKRNCIGTFGIQEDKTYSADAPMPRLIFPDNLDFYKRFELSTDKKNAVLISQYGTYHKLKQEFFLRWMKNAHFFDEIRNGKRKKTEFISFSSCLYMPMMSPGITAFGSWEIYAMKDHDVIYLWSGEKADDAFAATVSMDSYHGVYFEHVLTHLDPTASAPNQFEKVFAINEIEFGSHHILCLSDIDAVNDREEWVEIKVYKKCSRMGLQAKFLKFWAQSAVSGVKKLVVGEIYEGKVLSVEVLPRDDLAKGFNWSPRPCYSFQNRLLNWIKCHFKENNSEVVKKFSWKGIDLKRKQDCPDVQCADVSKPLFANWHMEDSETETETENNKRKRRISPRTSLQRRKTP